MNAFIPRPPSAIWSNGYGDCKEMANLLRALAGQGKVNVGLALIRSGPGIQLRREYPSLGCFNHMIAYRRGEDGGLRFYDPTVAFGSAPASSRHLLYQKVLLLAPGATTPDTLAPEDGLNRIFTRSQLAPSGPGGSLSLKGEIRIRGALANSLALDLRYHSKHPEEARACVRDFLRNGFGRPLLAATAQLGPNPRDQLAMAERLGQIIVGAQLESPHLVFFGIERREHDHGQLGAATQLLQHVQPIGCPEIDV